MTARRTDESKSTKKILLMEMWQDAPELGLPYLVNKKSGHSGIISTDEHKKKLKKKLSTVFYLSDRHKICLLHLKLKLKQLYGTKLNKNKSTKHI